MLWSLFFRVQYLLLRLFDPVVRVVWRRGVLSRVASLDVAGRRSGRVRRTLLTVLTVEGAWYVGHPNGAASWTRNLEAAGRATLQFAGGPAAAGPVRAVRLYGGPEREAAIRAGWIQQPFPANLIYAMARRHVRRVGVFFRLTPLDAAGEA